MLQNNTQTILLPNQPFLEQLQQNNQQRQFILNQQPLVQLQQNNRQQLLIPNQQILGQIQQNNNQPGVIPGQALLLNAQQNIPQRIILPYQTPIVQPQLNNVQPTIIQNQTPKVQPQLNNIQPSIIQNQKPIVQPQLNNVQPPIKPNQTPIKQPQLNNVQPAIMPNQTPIKQPQLKNAQPTNIQNQPALEKEKQNVQTKIENAETNANLVEPEYIKSMINELKDSEYADIEYSRGTGQKKVFKSIYNFYDGELFEIYLGKGDDKKYSFMCSEISESFQRYCVATSKRQFDMDMYYNISDEEPEYTKTPVLKIHRIEGGCCSDRGILIVDYPNNNKHIGIILQAFLANIYDANNQLLYRVKLPFEPERKTFFQAFCECCCGCGKKETVEEEKDYSNFLIKKLVVKEEQVEDIMVKKNVQVTVGKMESYPLRIIFPEDASPKEKILLIVCRIFLLYMMNFSVTLRERWYYTCKDIGKGLIEYQDQGILGKINNIKDYKEKMNKIDGLVDTIEVAGINKNIVSVNNYLDDYLDDEFIFN